MIKADYLLIAEDVTLDERNRQSIIRIFGMYHVPSVPAALRSAKITYALRSDDGAVVNKTLNIKLLYRIGDEETTLFEESPTVTIEKGFGWSSFYQFEQIVLPRFGDYKFELHVNGKKLGEAELIVRDMSELVEV